MLHNDDEFIYIQSDQEESEFKLEKNHDDDNFDCSKVKWALVLIACLAISIPALIHIIPAIFPSEHPMTNSSKKNMDILVKLEISYELFLFACTMYFTSPIWSKYIVVNSSLLAQSMFKRPSLSVSFSKHKRDVEASDDMDYLSDCEMEKRIQDLTQTDCSINSETPLRKKGEVRKSYTFV